MLSLAMAREISAVDARSIVDFLGITKKKKMLGRLEGRWRSVGLVSRRRHYGRISGDTLGS